MNAQQIKRYKADPVAFFAAVIVQSAHGERRMGDIWAGFQLDWFRAVAPSLLAVERGERPPCGRFFVERTKGGSKDTDVSLALLHAMLFSPRPLSMQIAAADQRQASEPREIIEGVLRLNPWMAERVEILNWKIVNRTTGSTCEILAADVGGSHGSRPDIVFLNELSHIADGKQDFAQTVLDNATKRPQGLVFCATNSGYLDTWQYNWREMARNSERWHYSALSEPSPYMDPAEIAELPHRMTAQRMDRLYYGKWLSGIGNALDEQAILDAIVLKGPMSVGNEALGYVGGLDVGVKQDRTGFAVIGIDSRNQRAKLLHCATLAPTPTRQVSFADIELLCEQAAWDFPGINIGFDPSQCLDLAQRLSRKGVTMTEVPFTPKNCNAMAEGMLQLFASRSIQLYPHPELLRDLRRLQIVERPWGYKLTAARTREGHADLGTAFAIAASGILPSFADFHEPDDGRIDVAGFLDLSF